MPGPERHSRKVEARLKSGVQSLRLQPPLPSPPSQGPLQTSWVPPPRLRAVFQFRVPLFHPHAPTQTVGHKGVWLVEKQPPGPEPAALLLSSSLRSLFGSLSAEPAVPGCAELTIIAASRHCLP